MKIGERILKYRKDNNFKQEDLAKKLGVSSKTISKWENNVSEPSIDTIMQLCKVFNVTIDEFLYGNKTKIKKDNLIKDSKDNRKRKAKILSLSVMLYFIALIWLIAGEEIIAVSDGVIASIFLALCSVPTCILIYYFTLFGNEENKEEKDKKEELPSFKDNLIECITLFTLIIYLILSFATNAWYITWLIWIIYACIIAIINLVYNLKGDVNEK